MQRRVVGVGVLLAVLVMANSPSAKAAPAEEAAPIAIEPASSARKPAREPSVALPVVAEGRVTREIKRREHSIRVELGRQKLLLELPEVEVWRERGQLDSGDVIRLKKKSTLRRKTTVLASLPAGQLLTVLKVHADNKWVETSVVANGRMVSGWLPVADVEYVASEPGLYPTLDRTGSDEFASAAVLAHKAKQFDDGLMAAVQMAAQRGLGKFPGKSALLQSLAQQLGGEDSAHLIQAACVLGKLNAEVPEGSKPVVDALINKFLKDEARSKPVGFYTWNKDLTALFQQDRILQTKLKDVPVADAIALAKAVWSDANNRRAYESYLTLQSKLTNPQVAADLRPLLIALDEGKSPEIDRDTKFFPPSYSHEIDLLKRLYPFGGIPEDFQLMDELVAQVESGHLDLTPRPDSGWYDRQLWSMEPYLLPQQMPEGDRWQANEEYQKHLKELFKGTWALARETHIKDLEVHEPAAEAPLDGVEEPEPKIEIHVSPQLSAEPVS
jgi:hypothetical protein